MKKSETSLSLLKVIEIFLRISQMNKIIGHDDEDME